MKRAAFALVLVFVVHEILGPPAEVRAQSGAQSPPPVLPAAALPDPFMAAAGSIAPAHVDQAPPVNAAAVSANAPVLPAGAPVAAPATPTIVPAGGQVIVPPPVILPPAPLEPAPYGAPPPQPAAAPPVQNELWFSADYLMWWTKAARVPPLLTTGSTGDAVPGALGQPNTSVLFGGDNLNYDTFSGMRINGSVRLFDLPGLFIEGNYFWLQQRSIQYSAISDGAGNPVLVRPVVDPATGNEYAYYNSFPGVLAGATFITTTSQLQGWELNLAGLFNDKGEWQFGWLAGVRALYLDESLLMQDQLSPLNAGQVTFQGMPVDPPGFVTDFDKFRTNNQFYGGQLGARLNWNIDRVTVDLTTKVALGATQQTIHVDGASFLTTSTFSTSVPGGILTQPTNMGRYSHNTFSVVPEVGLNFTYRFSRHWSLLMGYNFIYWSSVVRPGDQVNRMVSPALLPTNQGPASAGTSQPILMPRTTDYWAQGIHVGLEFRY